jgi:hypothetical protein
MMGTAATVPQTTLVLDADLPPNAWETRGEGKSRRHRKAIDEETFFAALEDPKVKTLAVGDAAYLDLLAIMKRPGCKTPRQREIEKANGVGGKRPAKPVENPFGPGPGTKSSGTPGTFKVDRSTFGGFEPEPPGTPGPGGTAS